MLKWSWRRKEIIGQCTLTCGGRDNSAFLQMEINHPGFTQQAGSKNANLCPLPCHWRDCSGNEEREMRLLRRRPLWTTSSTSDMRIIGFLCCCLLSLPPRATGTQYNSLLLPALLFLRLICLPPPQYVPTIHTLSKCIKKKKTTTTLSTTNGIESKALEIYAKMWLQI